MLKTFVLGFALSVGVAASASAFTMSAPTFGDDQGLVRVAERCGAGWYAYGPDKRCHKFETRYGSMRGTTDACPPAMHIGPEGHYCWPN